MEPISDAQVRNSAGGISWTVTDMKRLVRFLCLGTEGGTYYIKEQQLTLENALCVMRLAEDETKWAEALKEVVNCSVEGRAAKQNPTLFTLAYFCRQNKNPALKKAAYAEVNSVCRIPTHLFQFLSYCQNLSGEGKGWGRAHRQAVVNWYLNYEENPMKLALHTTKYKQRLGWSHRDVLRLSHPKPKSDGVGAIIKYVVKDLKAAEEQYLKEDSSEEVKKLFKFLNSVEKVTKATASDTSEVVQLIKENNLVREHIPTHLLNERDIWMALLDKMPLMALIRNLGKMSSLGLLKEGLSGTKLVVEKLDDVESLKHARIHPFNVLVALNTYKQGTGEKGNLEWPVCSEIVTALDRAFYSCFKFITPTKRRYLLALDVSGSMQTSILGSPSITCAMGSAAMAMVAIKTEGLYEVVAFTDVLKPVRLKPLMRLEEVERELSKFNFGATDCALPMVWAEQQKKKFDVFIVYTDSETWFREIHPSEALKQYRKSSGIPDAKLIVVGMAASSFTIADPEDAGMLDIAGFDSAAPEAMRNFVLGLI